MTTDHEPVGGLSRSDLALLIDALDSHEYWQLGATLPRKDGYVFVPGDMQPDTLWGEHEPSAKQQAAIDEIWQCRQVAYRLRAALNLPRVTDGRLNRWFPT